MLAQQQRAWSFTLYHHSHQATEGFEQANLNPCPLWMPGERFAAWMNLRLPFAAWSDNVDLLHLPANVGLWSTPIPTVVTIHDFVPLQDETTPPGRREIFERGIRRALKTATRIITPSAATRDELCRRFGYPAQQVSVIPWAADQRIARQEVTSEDYLRIRNKYAIDRPWLLNFSGSSPRKNAVGIIRALAEIDPLQRAAFVVVLVGCEPASRRETLEAMARELGVLDSLRLHGFAPHEDLAPLLRGAAGLLLPSFCEGFGLPILDAFACETAVLTSNLSSLPEVAGEAAVYCDPHEPASIAEGMLNLLDPATADELVAAGTLRLTSFSWEKTAELMAGAFTTAVSAARTRNSVVTLRPTATGEAP